MNDDAIKMMLALDTGNITATAFIASFFCKKMGIDKSELVSYLRKCAEINSADIDDEISRATISDMLEKVALTIESTHDALDDADSGDLRH
ncbi:hypothetical protein Q4997_002591 [Escherichia coli]|nr:hypothetical protein [Escherichia coli]